MHGYYIELSKAQAGQAPVHYIRRQTLKNAERFITPELKTFEDKALSSQSKALARERLLFDRLIDRLAEDLPTLRRLASGIAEIDVLSNFADRALQLELVRPALCDSPELMIDRGRHLVVESMTLTRSWPMTRSLIVIRGNTSSPAPTWAANPPSCVKLRLSLSWAEQVALFPRRPQPSATSTEYLPELAHQMI